MRPQSSPSPTEKSTAFTAVSPPNLIVSWLSWRIAAIRKGSRGSSFYFPELEVKQPLRPHDHEDDQEQRVNDHAVLGDRPQHLGQQREQDGGEDDAERVAHAAEDDHDHDLDALREIEARRRDGHLEVAVEPARRAGEEGADDEGRDLVARRVEADGLGGDLVVA